MPDAVLEAFEMEYGTKVIIRTYVSQDEAYRNITAGRVNYDLAVIEYDLLPALIADNLSGIVQVLISLQEKSNGWHFDRRR
jgi:spermidine/putrescine-binding protein